jgi:N-acetylglutamate synthase-like GNAT family acetyltransferase
MMSFNIRQAEQYEKDTLSEIALRSKAYWGYSDSFMQACKDELTVTDEKISSSDYQYFVVCEKAQIQGFAGLQRISDQICELDGLFIDPEYIGKGIGRVLFEHVLNVLKQQNFKMLHIHSDPNASVFYQKMGATFIRQVPSGSINGRELPLFTLVVDG